MKNPRLKILLFVVLIVCVSTRMNAQISAVTLPAGLQPAHSSEMVIFNGSLYMVLQSSAHTRFFLYKYNGSTFTHVPLPAHYKLYSDTQFEVLNGALFFMPFHAATDTTAELMSYDGGTFTSYHIPESVFPRDSMRLWGHRPAAYQGKLYIEMVRDEVNPVEPETRYRTFWIIYNGHTFTRRQISLGLVTIAPFAIKPQPASDKIIFQNKLITRYYDYVTWQFHLLEYNGTTDYMDRGNTGIIAAPGRGEMAVYNDMLYIPTQAPGSTFGLLNRYDGVTQTPVAIPAGLLYTNTTMEVYADKLWGCMNDGSPTSQLYGYDGSTFTLLPMPAGVNIRPASDMQTFNCKLYFTGTTGATIGGDIVYTLYAYTSASPCSRPVWPEALDRFESVSVDLFSHGDEWCWTNIDMKWPVITPCVLPDCINPLFRVARTEKPGGIGWSKDFIKPFTQAFPANNQKTYITTISLGDNASAMKDVIAFDKNVVPAGMTNIKLGIDNQNKVMTLYTTTLNQKDVPFTVALVDTNGKVIWKKDYTAPSYVAIGAEAQSAGAVLQFTARTISVRKPTVAVYPNPSADKVQVTVADVEENTPARIRISNAQGYIVYDKVVMAPAVERPAALAPGVYVVRVTVGKEEVTSRLVVKP